MWKFTTQGINIKECRNQGINKRDKDASIIITKISIVGSLKGPGKQVVQNSIRKFLWRKSVT